MQRCGMCDECLAGIQCRDFPSERDRLESEAELLNEVLRAENITDDYCDIEGLDDDEARARIAATRGVLDSRRPGWQTRA